MNVLKQYKEQYIYFFLPDLVLHLFLFLVSPYKCFSHIFDFIKLWTLDYILIKSNHFYCHITTAQVPWWVKFLWACSRQCRKTTDNLHMDRQCKKTTAIYIWTDSAKKQQQQFTYGQTVQKKQQQQFTYGQTVQKTTTAIYIWTDSAKKTTTAIYIWTDSAKKNNNSNLHMDRQCKKATAIYIWTDSAKKQQQFTYGQTVQKKQQQQFTYGQTVQKKQQQQFTYGQTVQKKTTTAIYIWTDSAKKTTAIYIWTDSAKKNNNSNLHMDRQCKKATAIYIWTVHITDCTEDNVQNTHTYTQYT